MFNFKEGETFVRAVWKGDGASFGVFLVLWSSDPKRETWNLYQKLVSADGESNIKNFKMKVSTPDHAYIGTIRMLGDLGGLLGLHRLQRADINSDTEDKFILGISEIEGVDLQSVPVLGILPTEIAKA